jgi:coproporphyrinogen III oxidase
MADGAIGSVTGVLDDADARKGRAAAWFRELRDAICARFEGIEEAYTSGPFSDLPAGKFERSQTHRQGEEGEDAGGGEMAVMRGGRVFEKVGVNISTVHGTLAPICARPGFRRST